MNKSNFIYLASASPRRCELLEQLGMTFEQVPADIDETPLNGEPPEDYVLRMALEKAHAAAATLDAPHVPVLGADTSVSSTALFWVSRKTEIMQFRCCRVCPTPRTGC